MHPPRVTPLGPLIAAVRRRLWPSREVRSRVLTLALPAVGEQLLNMTVGLVDTYMVGHLGATAVAAVGLSNQAVMLVTTFFGAVGVGVTALVARHTGARETGAAATVLHQGFLLGSVIGAVASLLGLWLAVPAMRCLQAPPDVVAPGATYLRVVSATFLLASLLSIGNAALRGAGDTRTPMYVMLIVNVTNVAVAVVAIYGLGPVPALGVTGSALGAATGRGLGGVLVLLALLRGRQGLRLRLGALRPEVPQLRRILHIGLPAGAELLALRFAMLTYTMAVAALGTKAFAAHQLALQAEALSYMPGFGFAVAATTLTGQGLGARRPEQARADALAALCLGCWVMCVMGVVFYALAAPILGLFIDDPEVVRLGVWPLRLVAFSQPALASVMILAGALRGAGDTGVTLLISAAGLWLIRVPAAFALTGPLGLLGAWVAMGLDLNARGLAFWLRFRSDRWTGVRV